MSNVRVAVRVRPLTKREEAQGAKVIVGIERDRLLVTNLKVPINKEHDNRARTRQFGFDFCYWSAEMKSTNFASQEMIYEDIGSKVLESVFEGFNACVLAYGQSGSGKTFTMMGQHGDLGLTPRICQGLFDRLMKVTDEQLTFRTEISFLEIYNEKVGDLLRPPTCNKQQQRRRAALRVREHPKLGPCVQDLSKHVVTDFAGVQALIERGNQNRCVAATRMHDHSSRSHAIFTINFIQARLDEDLPSEVVSKIHLVDLAGSERATVGMNKIRLKEGANINKSLVALGSVICALAEKSMSLWSLDSLSSSKSHTSSSTAGGGDSLLNPSTSPLGSSHRGHQPPFVPYRDSVLTWLLKDSLGGNSKTIMVATISPASTAYNETLSTLRYAQRAKCIVNKPIINEDPNVKLIRELKAEIARLRELLSTTKQNGILELSGEQRVPVSEIITRNQDKAEALTRCWIEKWHYFQRQTQETVVCNTCSYRANMIDCGTPCLLGSLNLFSDRVQIVCLKDTGANAVVVKGQTNTESDEPVDHSLQSSDTSEYKLCDSDMTFDQNEEFLKSLLNDGNESVRFHDSIVSDTTQDDPNGTAECPNTNDHQFSYGQQCFVLDTATNDDRKLNDDSSETDEFSFYAFDDHEDQSCSQFQEFNENSCGQAEKLSRYLSPIQECSSSQSQSPVMLPDRAVEGIAEETVVRRTAEVVESREFAIDIDSDSLNGTESDKVSESISVEKCQMISAESSETALNTSVFEASSVRSRRLSCYHIGFVSSDDDVDVNDMDTASISLSSAAAAAASNVASITRRTAATSARSKKQSYYIASNRNSCVVDTSSDDDTSHSYNTTQHQTTQQRFQRILMENRRKRRRKRKKDTRVHRGLSRSNRKSLYDLQSRETDDLNSEMTDSPLPLPRPPFWEQCETQRNNTEHQRTPILLSLLNEEITDSAEDDIFEAQRDTSTTFEVTPDVKTGSSTLLDCSFTTDSLENLSSRCSSMARGASVARDASVAAAQTDTACWNYNTDTLKKHSRRAAFKHSWPSCDSLTMVYMGPEWGSTETNLVASIQSLDDHDWFGSDVNLTGANMPAKKSFSDSCFFRNGSVADDVVLPLALSQPEMCSRARSHLDHDSKDAIKEAALPPNQTTAEITGIEEGGRGKVKEDAQVVRIAHNVNNHNFDTWSGKNYASMAPSSFFMNKYHDGQFDDDDQAEFSFFQEKSSVQTEKQSRSSAKTESSSDSGFQTEIATTNMVTETANFQMPKRSMSESFSQAPKRSMLESFSQTSTFLSDTSVQTDPVCCTTSTQTGPLLADNGCQTDFVLRTVSPVLLLPQQPQDSLCQANIVCKDASMQTSLPMQNGAIGDSKDAAAASELTACSAEAEQQADTIALSSACSNCSQSAGRGTKQISEVRSIACESGSICIGFHGKRNRVQHVVSIRCHRCGSDRSTAETAESVIVKTPRSQDDNEDCIVSDCSNDVTVSLPQPCSSSSTASLHHPESLNDDDVDVLDQHCSVSEEFHCSGNSCLTKDEESLAVSHPATSESARCATTFTQTDVDDSFETNPLKAFLYSSLGCGIDPLRYPNLEMFTEMESRIKALEVQCSELLLKEQLQGRPRREDEKDVNRTRIVEVPLRKKKKKTNKTRDQRQCLRFKEKSNKQGFHYDTDEEYYKLPNALKLSWNKRRKVNGIDNSVTLNELPQVLHEESQGTLKTLDYLLSDTQVPREIASQMSEGTTVHETETSFQAIFVNSEAEQRVVTSELQLQEVLATSLMHQDDSEDNYSSNIPEDILALLKECKAVRKKAWIEINLAHEQLGY